MDAETPTQCDANLKEKEGRRKKEEGRRRGRREKEEERRKKKRQKEWIVFKTASASKITHGKLVQWC